MSYKIYDIFLIFLPAEPYFLAEKGDDTCPVGSTIVETADCWTACNDIGGSALVNPKDSHPCYLAGNGKCRKDGKQGSGASLICKNEGNLIRRYASKFRLI